MFSRLRFPSTRNRVKRLHKPRKFDNGGHRKLWLYFKFLLLPAFYHAFSKYCDAKFAHQVYKKAGDYRSPSLVALNANCNRKTARHAAGTGAW